VSMEAEAVNPLVDGPSPSGGANCLHSAFARIRKTPRAINKMPTAIKMPE